MMGAVILTAQEQATVNATTACPFAGAGSRSSPGGAKGTGHACSKLLCKDNIVLSLFCGLDILKVRGTLYKIRQSFFSWHLSMAEQNCRWLLRSLNCIGLY